MKAKNDPFKIAKWKRKRLKGKKKWPGWSGEKQANT
jgi:hypothetical protein